MKKSSLVKIEVENLNAKVFIGCKPEEQKKRRRISICFAYQYNADKAIRADDITQALDYAKISADILVQISAKKFALIETLAHFILNILLNYSQVRKACVSVKKFRTISDAEAVAVHVKGKSNGI